MPRYAKILILPILLVCIGLHAAFGEVVQTHYKELLVLPAKQKDAISSADATTWATAINPKPTRGNPNLTAYCEFGTASATCVVECGLYFLNANGTYTYLGPAAAKQTATAAASGVTNGAGVYPALAPIIFDTKGAPYVDVRITTISTGTVTMRQWFYGAETKSP